MNRFGGFVKRVFLALAGLALAVVRAGPVTKYKDWDRSPEAYFLTPAERAEWKKLTTDAEAEKFIALYWAKRGGDPFKAEVSRRIAAADQQFKLARYTRGSDSVRGRLFVTLGPPSRVSQSRAQESGTGMPDGATIPGIDIGAQPDANTAITYNWTWDKDRLPPVLEMTELRASISVDPRVGTDDLRNGAAVEKAIATLAEKSIVNPNATLTAAAPGAPAASVPPAGAAPAAPAAGAPAAAPAAAGVAAAVVPLPAAVKPALESAASAAASEAGFWSGTFRSGTGDDFLAFQFYLPANKAAFSTASPLKLAGVVKDSAGSEVHSFWEEASFGEVAEGNAQRPRRRQVGGPAAGLVQGVLRPLRRRGAASGGRHERELHPESEDDRVRSLAADSLGRARAPDQASRSERSLRLRLGQAHQGRAQGRSRIHEAGQPLVLLRSLESGAARAGRGGPGPPRGRRDGRPSGGRRGQAEDHDPDRSAARRPGLRLLRSPGLPI